MEAELIPTRDEHARLSCSNHRWPNCPGSVREEAAYPDIPGEAAKDGTGSHLLLEMCLKNNVRAEVYDQQVVGANHPDQPNGWLVGKERCERVQMCLDYIFTRVKTLREEYPGSRVIVEAESRADPGGAFGRDDWWGTCDVTITVVNKHDRCQFMEIVDYKDGQGWVSAENNSQLISYLFGKLRPFIASGPDLVRPFLTQNVGGDCRMTIVQPKTNPVVRYHDMPVNELVEAAENLSWAATKTDFEDAPLVPDDKGGKGYCRWCKHKPNCPAHGRRDLEKVKTMGNDIQTTEGTSLFELANQLLDNVQGLPTEKLTQLLDAEAGIMSVFEQGRAELERRIETGEQVNGWDIKPGRGTRVWNDTEENIVKKLKGKRLKKEDIYPPKMASPAQILGLSKLTQQQKDSIEKELVAFKAGKPKLTQIAHDKKAERLSAEDMFADVPSFTETPAAPKEQQTSFLDAPQDNNPQDDDEISFL